MKLSLGLFAAILATASAAVAQTVPEQAPARRPDGSIIYPGQAGGSSAGDGAVMRPGGGSAVLPGASGVASPATEAVPVRRPDGSVVYPPQATTRERAPSSAIGDNARGADDLERRRQETQRAMDERVERSRREREAAASNPSRQLPPTSGAR